MFPRVIYVPSAPFQQQLHREFIYLAKNRNPGNPYALRFHCTLKFLKLHWRSYWTQECVTVVTVVVLQRLVILLKFFNFSRVGFIVGPTFSSPSLGANLPETWLFWATNSKSSWITPCQNASKLLFLSFQCHLPTTICVLICQKELFFMLWKYIKNVHEHSLRG